MPAEIG
jgi:ABC-type bacteriocin/lantibiotic exporter with double-glycine peptidase domain